jgi:hypothetical protein
MAAPFTAFSPPDCDTSAFGQLASWCCVDGGAPTCDTGADGP